MTDERHDGEAELVAALGLAAAALQAAAAAITAQQQSIDMLTQCVAQLLGEEMGQPAAQESAPAAPGSLDDD